MGGTLSKCEVGTGVQIGEQIGSQIAPYANITLCVYLGLIGIFLF
jgi:hypothetical protein